jgi:hypothetical protein
MSTEKKWTLLGYDTFSDEYYHLGGTYPNKEEALKAARKYLEELEKLQPSKESGGQSELGIQDHVYIISPEGLRIRVLEASEQDSLVGYT